MFVCTIISIDDGNLSEQKNELLGQRGKTSVRLVSAENGEVEQLVDPGGQLVGSEACVRVESHDGCVKMGDSSAQSQRLTILTSSGI